MRRVALLLTASLLTVVASPSVQAQERPNPRWEIAGGALLLPTAAAVTLTVGFVAGPGLFPCGVLGDDSADQACNQEASREQREAWITGGILGSLVAAVGIGLIVHGSRRLRRMNAAPHSSQLTVLPAQLARDGYGLLAYHRF